MATETLAVPRLVFLRIAASLLGGYVFTWGFAAMGIALLPAFGVSFNDAYSLTMMLAFLVFLTVFCWSFAAEGIVQVWALLTGVGALMTGSAWTISRFLI
ncbi:MAG: iron uptake protein [Gammaproteobacteria bacterium]|nr:iron uptake protein [Gammaproteobacteria bacterium]